MPVDPDHLQASPDVSVIIAAFNAADFIDRAIKSALDQAGMTLEVLVIDDRSTDATCERVAFLAKQDPRIRLVRMERNGGPSAARNAGIDAAQGAWIAVLDADDAFLPGRLSRLVSLARARAADIIADNFVYYNVNTDEMSTPALPAGGMETLDLHTLVSRCLPYAEEQDYGLLKPIFNRAFLERTRLRYPVHVRHGEDFLLVFHAVLAGARYLLSRDAGYAYTTRDSGRSRTKVDYLGQADIALDLARLPQVAGEPALVSALRRRARALRRLDADWRVRAAWQNRAHATLARIALTDPRGMIEIARKVTSRLRTRGG